LVFFWLFICVPLPPLSRRPLRVSLNHFFFLSFSSGLIFRHARLSFFIVLDTLLVFLAWLALPHRGPSLRVSTIDDPRVMLSSNAFVLDSPLLYGCGAPMGFETRPPLISTPFLAIPFGSGSFHQGEGPFARRPPLPIFRSSVFSSGFFLSLSSPQPLSPPPRALYFPGTFPTPERASQETASICPFRF